MTRRADPEGLVAFTREVGGRTLVARCEPALAPEAASLLEEVASRAPTGRGLAEGATFEVGWCVLRLLAVEGGLVLCEPDFEHGGHVSHVQHTLAVLRAQGLVLRRLRVAGQAPRHDAKVAVVRGSLAEPRLHLERRPPGPGDAGWSIGPADEPEEAADLETLSVGDLVERRFGALQLLALPPGYMAVLDGDRVEAVFDPEDEDVWAATEGSRR
jgi:hypothetical protein